MNDYIKIYRERSDDQILYAYKERSNYNSDAIDAMETVLKERGLSAMLENIKTGEKLQEKIYAEQLQLQLEEAKKNYEQAVFGTIIPDEQYAFDAKDVNGVFWKAPLKKGTIFSLTLTGSLFAMAIISLVCFIVRVFMGEELFKNDILIFSITAVIFLGLGILLSLSNDTYCKLHENSRKIFFEIHDKKNIYQIQFPFLYEFYTGMIRFQFHAHYHHIPVPIKTKNPLLYFYMKDDKNEKILIMENLPAWGKLPTNLQAIEDCVEELKGSKVYSVLGLNRMHLRKLKKILDGLSEINFKES